MLPGCLRLADKPRMSSLIVDQGMNNMEVEGEEKKGKNE
jgi:murein L,D-transpeptidase YcbB/YkuD